MKPQRVTVYCASSNQVHPEFHAAARRLGELLAQAGVAIVYGGGRIGSMGQLADGALAHGGTVVGVIPGFMQEIEWGHPGLSELIIVDDMHGRKRRMLEQTDAVIALPGGCGTYEELFEALTLKRLGLFDRPILMVDARDHFQPLRQLLEQFIAERFMSDRHRAMWQFVNSPDEVLSTLASFPPWGLSAQSAVLA
ncbi:MAG: TIGR00730 family Rossman fold protein [Planctomycetaceae bacterium]